MHSDPISDFITQIRNASAVDKGYVSIPHSNLKEKLTDLLVNEGYLSGYKIEGKNQTKSINIAPNIKITPPSLSGTDLKIA